MSDRTVADSARLTSLVLSRGLRFLRQGTARPLRGIGLASVRSPSRLLIAPPDIRTADPTVSADIYAGYFVFEGKPVNTHGRSPFTILPPSEDWAAALADFGWLRHLRAADSALSRVNARALVGDWISQAGQPGKGPAWTPAVVSKRILAWLSQSPIILEGADGTFYRKFMRSLGRQCAFLRREIRAGLGGEARLLAAIALTELGLCVEGHHKLQRQATRILVEDIGTQILPDGGHISRDPGVLVELLLYLLPLRQAFVAAGVQIPPPLLNAVDRMIPMVRTFRHGDGALALFNGMGVTRPEALATILAYDDVRGRPLSNAPHSGYQRLDAGEALLIVDAGPPPPAAFSQKAHAGTLAFEFSVGTQQLIVNCGTPASGPPTFRAAARATAAHSTLVLADHSSSRFVPGPRFGRGLEGLLYAGPRRTEAKRTEEAGAVRLDLSHDGYLRRFGLVHRRSLVLAADGGRLDGEDQLERAALAGVPLRRRRYAEAAFALRFHLHPSLRIRVIRDGTAVVIAFPTGELWQFEASGLPVKVEESIYLASADGARRTDQLVVSGQSGALPRIVWSLWRQGHARLN